MGSMKTIGMTGKQVRSMLNWQVVRLAAAGILAGTLAGTGVNVLVIRLLADAQLSFARYYEVGGSLVYAAAAGAFFAAVTVCISNRKALSLAAKVSPVEAARFRASGKKKKVFAVISFALSGILFCALFTAFVGYDTEWMADRMNEADYKVYQYHADQVMDDPYEPIDMEFAQKVADVDFADESYIYYRASNIGAEPDDGVYPEALGAVKFEGCIREVAEEEMELTGVNETWASEVSGVLESGSDYETGILGMDASALPMEAKNLNVYNGELDPEKFASGDYLIYQSVNTLFAGEDFEYSGMNAGEEITLSFAVPGTDSYVEKTFTVMAVVGTKPDCYAGEMKEQLSRLVDAVLLDVSLADGDSRNYLEAHRREVKAPVIFLTARSAERDQIRGFDAGADDYVTKPFSIPLLLRRLRAVLRRNAREEDGLYRTEDLTYDFHTKTLKKAGEPVALSRTEIRILEILIENRNQVLTWETMLEKIWDIDGNFVDKNTLSVNIARLRGKIEEDRKNPRHILNVFGIGYKWSDENGK